MRIGIDISQAVYEGTGVGRYVTKLTEAILASDRDNEFILFGGSWGRRGSLRLIAERLAATHPRVRIRIFPFPPRFMDLIWNRLHVVPIEWLIGHIDLFWSSDWTQPPLLYARGVTTIHDVSFLRFPESFDRTIVETHLRRLERAKLECDAFLADSEATKRDIIELLGIPARSISVVYPGV
jgi:glycosyltransferase involved in cell wall biosynthesis